MAQIPNFSHGIFFLEFGQKYKKYFNLSMGSKVMSQKADLKSHYTLLHPCYIKKKVASKGIDGCYIGEMWRKVAEIG